MKTDNNSIKKEDFASNLLHFLKETFEGTTPEGNSFIDKGTGLFDTIKDISANDASKSIGETDATIVAHLEHTRFYILVLQEFMNGRIEKVDWKQNWELKTVDDKEWHLFKAELKSEYEKTTRNFENIENWDDDKISDALGIVVHTAYHLGAIRQIVKSIK